MLTKSVCWLWALAAVLATAGALPVEAPSELEEIPDEQFVQQMQSMFNTYKTETGEFDARYVLKTKVRFDDPPKFHAWKRNADLINSLLALPKGLSDAGR